MKHWLTASELADLALPGMPATQAGIARYIEREGWSQKVSLVRLRAARGGGLEYSIDLLPHESRAIYTARALGACDIPEAVARAAESEPAAQQLLPLALESRDARLALLALADRYCAEARLPKMQADGTFAALWNAGGIEAAPWLRHAVAKLSPRTLARWRSLAKKGHASRLGVDRGANRRGKGALDSTPGVKTFLLGAIAHQPHLSAHHLRTLAADAFPAIALPPLRTFQHVVAVWKKTHDVALTKITNPDRFKSHFRASARGIDVRPQLCQRLRQRVL